MHLETHHIVELYQQRPTIVFYILQWSPHPPHTHMHMLTHSHTLVWATVHGEKPATIILLYSLDTYMGEMPQWKSTKTLLEKRELKCEGKKFFMTINLRSSYSRENWLNDAVRVGAHTRISTNKKGMELNGSIYLTVKCSLVMHAVTGSDQEVLFRETERERDFIYWTEHFTVRCKCHRILLCCCMWPGSGEIKLHWAPLTSYWEELWQEERWWAKETRMYRDDPCFSTPLASHPSPLCSLSAAWFGCSFPHLSPINCSRKSPQL